MTLERAMLAVYMKAEPESKPECSESHDAEVGATIVETRNHQLTSSVD